MREKITEHDEVTYDYDEAIKLLGSDAVVRTNAYDENILDHRNYIETLYGSSRARVVVEEATTNAEPHRPAAF